jgi:glutaredoxin
MKLIRFIVGKIILFLDAAVSPGACCPENKSEGAKYRGELSRMSIYQFEACPFCVKVRRALRRRGFDVDFRDAKNDKKHEKELIELGGRRKVPCLRIEKDGQDEWIYESKNIIEYLDTNFPCQNAAR